MKSQHNSPLIVAGTGPAGMIAALALAQSGQSVTLIGPETGHDGRTTALMTPALGLLEDLDLLSRLQPVAAPLRTMRIIDATSRLLRSPTVTFRASEIGQAHFGLNIPNTALLDALCTAIVSSQAITWLRTTVEQWAPEPDMIHARLADGTTTSARLAIAADGRNSPARAAAGIRVSTRSYRQAALVLNFAHTRDHGDISTEFHTETGPFTQVPLPGRNSSLVWVVTPETAQMLADLDDMSLSQRVEERMQSMLGQVTVAPGRQIYPLSAALPARFAKNRVALIGEAAHVFPPIGAQGLNLGIRDIQDLIRTLSENVDDAGSDAALAHYDHLRRPDIVARSAGVTLLNRSLLSDLLPAQMARGLGLSILGAISPLRSFFMREGLSPGSGWRGAVSDLGKQVRRQRA